MRFCTQMGGEVTRLSWRKCQKVAPSWSGLRGAPRGGLAVGDQAGEGLVQFLGAQGRAEFDPALDLDRSELPSECERRPGTMIVSPAPARRS